MKIKDGLILRKVAGQFVIVPTGKRTREVQRMIYISSSAAALWVSFQDAEFTEQDMVDKILSLYTGVTEEIARRDVGKFLEVLRRNQVLEPEPGQPECESGCVMVSVEDHE